MKRIFTILALVPSLSFAQLWQNGDQITPQEVRQSIFESNGSLGGSSIEKSAKKGETGIIAKAASATTNDADHITNDVAELARGLRYDAWNIFEYCVQHIKYQHYFGCKKGAALTYLEGSGNSFDTAALMIALLKESVNQGASYTNIKYRYGVRIVLNSEMDKWWGLLEDDASQPTSVPFPDLNDTEFTAKYGDPPDGKSIEFFRFLVNRAEFCLKRSFPKYQWGEISEEGRDSFYILVPHVWVQFDEGGNTWEVDPSYKLLVGEDEVISTDIQAALSTYNRTTLLSALGGSEGSNGEYVSGLNDATLNTSLTSYTSNLLSHIRTNSPNASVDEIVGSRAHVISQTEGKTWTDYDLIHNEDGGLDTVNTSYLQRVSWDNMLDQWMSKVTITVGEYDSASEAFTTTYATDTVTTASLQGKKISLTFNGNAGTVSLDDTAWLSFNAPNATVDMKVSVDHPYGSYPSDGDGISNYVDDGVIFDNVESYNKGDDNYYVISYGFDPSGRLLRKRQEVLEGYRRDGLTEDDNALATEMLNVAGLQWVYQTALGMRLMSDQNNISTLNEHRFGRVAREGTASGNDYVYVDFKLQRSSSISNESNVPKQQTVFHVENLVRSAMEHSVVEDSVAREAESVSTVKIFHAANGGGQKLYRATPSNWNAGDNVRATLAGNGYSTGNLDVIESYITTYQADALIPENPTVSINQWDGSGYAVAGNNIAGMLIGGNLAGAYTTTDNLQIDSGVGTTVSTETRADPSHTSSSGFDNIVEAGPSVPITVGGDPVNMGNGAFLFDKPAMSCGGAPPRGLGFVIHYNSASNNDDSKGMGYGWTHNQDLYVVERSATRAGLGLTTPEQAAPFLAAMTVASDLYENGTTAKDWAASSMVCKWAVDQLLSKGVSITMGNQTIEFVEMPDGTYSPPAGLTMMLSKDGSDNYVLQERHGNTYSFNADNLLETITDQHGNTATYTYSGGLLTEVADCYGRTLTFARSGDKISSVSETAGSLSRSVSFTYTGDDLTGYTDPEGKTTTFAYDSEHRLTDHIDAKGRTVIENIYDTKGRVKEQFTHGDTGKKWQLFFTGYCNRETNPQGGEISYFYDSRGRGIGKRDATGVRTRQYYDGQDHVTVSYKPSDQPFTHDADSYNTEPATRRTYNGDHNLTQVDLPERFAGDPNAPYTTTREYDGQKRLWKQYDHKGNFTQYSYNTAHQVLTITDRKGITVVTNTYNPDGTLNTTADADSNVTTYSLYSAYGQAQTITYPAVTAGTYTEQFTYNERGDILSRTDRRGNTTSTTYNNRRQPLVATLPAVDGVAHTISNSYDDCGLLASSTDTRGNSTSHTYSPTEKRLTTTLPTIAAGSPSLTSSYDSRDWLQTTQDPLGNTTNLTYDAAQRLKTTTDPLSRVTENFYNGEGELTETRNAESESVHSRYNDRGELYETDDGEGATTAYAFDKNGNRASLTNRRGHTYSYSFDDNDRQLTLSTPTGKTATNAYNNRGLITSITEPSTDALEFSHDELGRVEQTTVKDNGATISTISYTRDGNGNLTQVTEGGQTVSRSFDERNRVESYTDANGNTIQYTFDGNNNLLELTYPGGVKKVTYIYNSHNQLKTVTDWDGRVTTFNYDLNGRRTQVDLPNGTSRRMAYDSAGQLIGMSDRAKGGTQQPLSYCLFQYDNAGRVICETASPTPQTFAAPNISATYDNDNRLLTFNGTGITHDVDGNMTSGPLLVDGNVTYNFDSRNRLTSVGSTSYLYDPQGTRLSLTEGGTTTTYVTDPNTALSRVLMRVKGGQTTYYIHGGGLLYQINPDGTTSTYHFDHLGSTVAISADDGQTIEERVEYTPYGTIAYRESTFDTPFLFNGQYGVQTDANGLLYMRARYYNPYIRRFINQDPAGFAGGSNWFSYASGDPINLLDPFGLAPQSTTQSGYWNCMTGCYHDGAGNRYIPEGNGLTLMTPNVPDVMGGLHNTLDMAGLVPVLGEPADAANALLYLSQGDVGNAALSGAGMIPFLGWGATGTKFVTKYGDEVVAIADDVPANTPVGHRNSIMSDADPSPHNPQHTNAPYQPVQNSPGNVGGRDYSGHAFDQMRNRGLTPTVVENAIQNGTRTTGNTPGTSVIHDASNNVTVIVNEAGRVVTVY